MNTIEAKFFVDIGTVLIIRKREISMMIPLRKIEGIHGYNGSDTIGVQIFLKGGDDDISIPGVSFNDLMDIFEERTKEELKDYV